MPQLGLIFYVICFASLSVVGGERWWVGEEELVVCVYECVAIVNIRFFCSFYLLFESFLKDIL